VSLETLTTWLDLAGLALGAAGLGALAGGVLLGPVVLGIGMWLLVTGVVITAGSVWVTWHNDARSRQQAGGMPR
jgi:hypothetical protein